MKHIINFVYRMAIGYEPVAFRAAVSALFATLALGGIGTGALPARVEMGLGILAIVVPFLLNLSARSRVKPAKAAEAPATGPADSQVRDAPLDVPDDPAHDFVIPAGAHRR